MKSILLVATGGAAGAVLRYLISLWIKQSYDHSFPWPTFFINCSGCFLIGLCFRYAQVIPSPDLFRLLFMVGVLGGFTTFSSFGLETYQLIQNRLYFQSIMYVTFSNVMGLLLVFAGYHLMQLFR